ncbi:unnamed protein product [Calypogeia fissa]
MATQTGGNPPVEKIYNVHSAENGVKADHSKKLRILCLHGFRTSGNILAQQVQLANWAPIIDDIAELVFMDAPWPAQGKSDVENRFDGPYYEWYQFSAGFTEATGLEEAASHFTDFIALHGPFHGLMGFSQGGIVAAAWIGLNENGLGPNMPNINFAIVVGGGRSRAQVFEPAYKGTINCPSIHFVGEKDFMKASGESLAQEFKDPVVLSHPFAHVVPRLGANDAQIFRDFLLKQQQAKLTS